ncbi:MAG: aldo/keto reductase [Hyphomicrobiaceae bacterium]
MRYVTLANGVQVPALGLGTWHMGDSSRTRSAEVKALQRGLDLGLTLIDTAEMYAEGGAEEVVGEAIVGRRDQVYLVSKVYPHNASRAGVVAACARSLKRMKVEHIDLYLLHWRGQFPLTETVEAFERLKSAGKIGAWGVSNFDSDDIEELAEVAEPQACLTDQVLYHLGSRGIEFDLIPACRRDGISIMAYSPLGQGTVLDDPGLVAIAKARGLATATIALAWVLRHPNVIAIPKSSSIAHVEANAAAQDLVLTADELATLDKSFPPPKRKVPLGML